MLAFWMGGACARAGIIPPVQPAQFLGTNDPNAYERGFISDDDEEILTLIPALYRTLWP